MEPIMPKLPVDISSFEKMRTEGYLYVDKTQHIYRIVTEGTFYFLSRPRRFGKSLLVSTLACLFQGRKDLFEGLWIAAQSDWGWQAFPVLALDFNTIPGGSADELKQGLGFRLKQAAEAYGITLAAPFLELQFDELICKLYKATQKPVVVLIDEYDKRIIEHLGKGEEHLTIAKSIRDVLKTFFGILKGQSVSDKLRLVFLTGVSRFSKVSLFSDLNNLRDLSMREPYADLLGYTQAELETNFAPYLAQLAEKLGWPRAQLLTAFAAKYDGYRFTNAPVRVYNPFSVLNALNDFALQDYWFESATPAFLVNLLRERQYHLPEIEGLQVSRTIFTNFDIDLIWPEALLFQTGYVTIRDVQQELYTLGYPNQEVKHAFTEALLLGLAAERRAAVSSLTLQLPGYLQRNDVAGFIETMQAIFASVPYDIQTQRDEAYFHTIFYLMLSASGLVDVQSSVLTSKGRIDLVVEFPAQVYIIEFKCNQNAATALRQIQDKQYAAKYRRSGKTILLLGINFNRETRNIEEWTLQPDQG